MKKKCKKCGGAMLTAEAVAGLLQQALTPKNTDAHYCLGALQSAAVFAMGALRGCCITCTFPDVEALLPPATPNKEDHDPHPAR